MNSEYSSDKKLGHGSIVLWVFFFLSEGPGALQFTEGKIDGPAYQGIVK